MTLDVRKRRDRKRCRTARVWYRGVDVSARCYKVDGRRRRAWAYAVDAEGRKMLTPDHRGLQREVLYGVTFRAR